jgi:curved DNA-binding protein CbpA
VQNKENNSGELNMHEPREGVDYLVDLYAIAGVESTEADTDQIRHAIRDQTKLYHPDVLDRAATEIKQTGKRISALLNRA